MFQLTRKFGMEVAEIYNRRAQALTPQQLILQFLEEIPRGDQSAKLTSNQTILLFQNESKLAHLRTHSRNNLNEEGLSCSIQTQAEED